MKKKGTSILKLIDGIGNIYIYIYIYMGAYIIVRMNSKIITEPKK